MCSTVLLSPPSGFLDGHIRDIHSHVVSICGCVQFVPRTTRTASEIQNASGVGIFLNVRVDAIKGCPIEAVPPTLREFDVPQVPLDVLGPVSLKQSAQNILYSPW